MPRTSEVLLRPTLFLPSTSSCRMADSTTVDAGIPGMFVNPEIPLDSLPGTESLEWTPLHPRFARRLQVAALIRAVFIVGAWSAFHFALLSGAPPIAEYLPWLPALAWTVIGAFCLWSLVWPLVAVPRRGYVVRDKDLLYKSGVLWRSVKAFPFNRVQHTKLDSTPLDRRFGLASLSVFPAGAGAGQRVRGLGQETAERLRVYISERIEQDGDAEPGDEDAAPALEGDAETNSEAGEDSGQ